jgi:NAD(P)-dependent dehydrogenase (short-subunit alcohol dehydrogenase family)
MAQRTWLLTGVSSGFGRHLAEAQTELAASTDVHQGA